MPNRRENTLSTLYELFKVEENATQEEITESYNRILEKANSLPQNEKIIEQIRRIKIAYGILSDSEKRKKYDLDLADKRTNELLQKVQIKQEETNHEREELDEQRMKQNISEQINRIVDAFEADGLKNQEEQKLAEKLQKKQFKKAKREAKRQQQIKREMEIQAYGSYLEKQGYRVKYPWTWLRVKRLLIAIVTIMITGVILWHIPVVRNALIHLYEENFVIKFLVDAIVSIFDGIMGGEK